ncbi:CAP domain-containing protein [Flavobacterium sp. LC2016-23]|uniref:CAP domain-containing protein n=1 Tax=Flavobacterium sp. LC2016-23 TaxID=2666330 RepID=UPI0012AF9973|nr:CAP domain-containing protein [Flavobacterium sp. LC2016-23]MRX40447.1 CAP domain-containing protein [Flavobacterium sp. LC2016-23]
MKKIMRTMMFVVMIITMNSCSADTAEGTDTNSVILETLNVTYTYNDSELELMQLINNYRTSIGLNALEKVNHISNKCEEHNKYMIANNVVDHSDFVSRSENIMKVLAAKNVGENVAYNYKTSEAVLKAWLESPGHKKNIEGNYTHFGISVTTDPATGKKYYTNIFARI